MIFLANLVIYFVSHKDEDAGHLHITRKGKIENQFARISRLRKFVISKSQNPKI